MENKVIGDNNETHKLREEKGKARQIEDEDEEMENSDIGDVENEEIFDSENKSNDRELSNINSIFEEDDNVFEAPVVCPLYYT